MPASTSGDIRAADPRSSRAVERGFFDFSAAPLGKVPRVLKEVSHSGQVRLPAAFARPARNVAPHVGHFTDVAIVPPVTDGPPLAAKRAGFPATKVQGSNIRVRKGTRQSLRPLSAFVSPVRIP